MEVVIAGCLVDYVNDICCITLKFFRYWVMITIIKEHFAFSNREYGLSPVAFVLHMNRQKHLDNTCHVMADTYLADNRVDNVAAGQK